MRGPVIALTSRADAGEGWELLGNTAGRMPRIRSNKMSDVRQSVEHSILMVIFDDAHCGRPLESRAAWTR